MFTIEIPELEYENVSVRAEQVRKGEEVLDKAGFSVTVKDVKVGPKWVTLFDKDDKIIWRLERGGGEDYVRVSRVTEESRKANYEADYRLYVNTELRKKAAAHVNRSKTTAALAKVQEDAEKYYLDSFRIDHLINAQAEDIVLDNFYHAVNTRLERNEDADLYAFVDEYKTHLTKQLVSGVRGTSRSTSVVSNAMDDAKHEAMAKFLNRGLLWFI
jgi:hypothetical protein